MDDDQDAVADTGHSFVDAVIYHLLDEMMQATNVGAADVHAGALADRLQAFQNLNGAGIVAVVAGRYAAPLSHCRHSRCPASSYVRPGIMLPAAFMCVALLVWWTREGSCVRWKLGEEMRAWWQHTRSAPGQPDAVSNSCSLSPTAAPTLPENPRFHPLIIPHCALSCPSVGQSAPQFKRRGASVLACNRMRGTLHHSTGERVKRKRRRVGCSHPPRTGITVRCGAGPAAPPLS